MRKWDRPLEPQPQRELRDFINGDTRQRGRTGEVDAIIRLAIASASRTLQASVRKPEVAVSKRPSASTSAFEQRLVALFSE